MHRISWKGVVIGNIVDIVSTNIVVLPLIFYMLAPLAHSGITREAASATLMASTTFIIWSSILGGLCSVLGGYVSARIARHDEVLNGALSSILCIGSAVYALLGGGATGHTALHVLFLPLSAALGALGGYLSAQRKARKA